MASVEPRQRSDGSKFYRVRVRDENGNWVIVNKDAGSNKARAGAWAEKYEVEKKADGGQAIADRRTLDALNDWLNSQPFAPGTATKYRYAIVCYVKFSGHETLRKINPDEINRYRVAMETGTLKWTRNGKKWYPYSPTSANIRMVDLKTFCSYCKGRGWLNKNPFDHIQIIEPERTERFLTRSEAGRLLWAARLDRYVAAGGTKVTDVIREAVVKIGLAFPDLGKKAASTLLKEEGIKVWPMTIQRIWKRHGMPSPEERRALKTAPPEIPVWIKNKRATSLLRRILHFGLYTGLRESEARMARREKLAHREIVEPRSGAILHQYLLEVKGKGRNKKRVIPLPPLIVRINGIAKMVGQSGPIFDGLTKSKLAQARRRAVQRAGLGRVRFHDLRHSFARNYLLSGAGGTTQAKKMMGHTRLSSLERYAHYDIEDIAETIGMVKPR